LEASCADRKQMLHLSRTQASLPAPPYGRSHKERPRLISDLAPEVAQLIEDVTVDSKGRLIPRLYSKLQASKELRAMLNIGRPERESDISRLSDAELIAQLADQAKQLGVEINLNYDFAKQPEPESDSNCP
jgi:hypothetical protein